MNILLGVVGIYLYTRAIATAAADVRCRVDVSYKWAKSPPTDTGATPSAAPATPGPESQIRFAFLEKTAADEKVAKEALMAEVNRAKARASESCRRDHENLAGCVATKFAVQGGVLGRLSFSAQKRLEAAIEADCRSQVGTCTEILSSDPVCEQVGTVEPTPAAAEEAAKGDKKGKEKKK
jgi:hypothetical protein